MPPPAKSIPPADVRRNEQGGTAFPKRPRSINKGDTLIIYAVVSWKLFGRGRIYAVEEVLSEEAEERGRDPYTWVLPTRRVAVAPSLARAPTLSDIDVDSRAVARRPYLRLDDDKGRQAEALIRAQDEDSIA